MVFDTSIRTSRTSRYHRVGRLYISVSLRVSARCANFASRFVSFVGRYYYYYLLRAKVLRIDQNRYVYAASPPILIHLPLPLLLDHPGVLGLAGRNFQTHELDLLSCSYVPHVEIGSLSLARLLACCLSLFACPARLPQTPTSYTSPTSERSSQFALRPSSDIHLLRLVSLGGFLLTSYTLLLLVRLDFVGDPRQNHVLTSPPHKVVWFPTLGASVSPAS